MSFSWDEVILNVVSEYDTPCYISALQPIIDALNELKALQSVLPIRHWLSFKTHPVAPLIREWRNLGLGIEVVSMYEFLAALKEGYDPSNILVNGVAKHNWLSNCNVQNIRLHFDSREEINKLAPRAHELGWRIGIRFHVNEEFDPDEPEFGGQFGFSSNELGEAIAKLDQQNIAIESIHFHLKTNVSSADCYRRALDEVALICDKHSISPRFIDCGGGLPVPGEKPYEDNSNPSIDLKLFGTVLSEIPSKFPDVNEIWLENGRFVSARSCVLVVKVLDIKERTDCRYLICDGGRTNHALVSDWETHDVHYLPRRSGFKCFTTICGPTCMAYDRLIRTYLPCDIQIGDHIVWMNAGAYHVPWETRFSHGLANVIWCDSSASFSLARQHETFGKWWGVWSGER